MISQFFYSKNASEKSGAIITNLIDIEYQYYKLNLNIDINYMNEHVIKYRARSQNLEGIV